MESRVAALESLVSHLTSENAGLRQVVSTLQLDVTHFKNRVDQQQNSITATKINTTSDQEDLNSNVIISGVDVNENTTATDLLAVYEGLISHLNISEVAELAPVSVTVLPTSSTKTNATFRPIRVQLQSVAAKVKLLQTRRVKKDILQSEIGLESTSRRPILISEQLTRANQELLYQARSLRGQNNFKFVWSTNGQILARRTENTKVIRITDTEHVNRIRAELNLEKLPEHGRLHTTTSVQHGSNIP